MPQIRTNTRRFPRSGAIFGQALTWLEAALRERHEALLYLKVYPLLDPMRDEPRFKAIERALKVPPQ